MGKSVEGSYINLTDDLETIKKRLAKVPTDSGTLGGQIPQIGGVASLFGLIYLVGGKEMHHKYVLDYKDKKIRYGEMKEELSQAIYEELAPFRERRKKYEENPELVEKILKEHTEKCRKIAQETLREVKMKMGFL